MRCLALLLVVLCCPGCFTSKVWEQSLDGSVDGPEICGTTRGSTGKPQWVVRYSRDSLGETIYYFHAVPTDGPLVYRGGGRTPHGIAADLSDEQRAAIDDAVRRGLPRVDAGAVQPLPADGGRTRGGSQMALLRLKCVALGINANGVAAAERRSCCDPPPLLSPDADAAVLVPATLRRPAGEQAKDIAVAAVSTPVWLAVDLFIVLPWWAIETLER